ncbi:hypothetical protein [Brachybacterium sp. GPGPB12]|uniref:hypothetical protein n=1 Tax=Brachybacterium sp. GPGPB12 TaxID=3023517 RepID=UPI0031342BD0
MSSEPVAQVPRRPGEIQAEVAERLAQRARGRGQQRHHQRDRHQGEDDRERLVHQVQPRVLPQRGVQRGRLTGERAGGEGLGQRDQRVHGAARPSESASTMSTSARDQAGLGLHVSTRTCSHPGSVPDSIP